MKKLALTFFNSNALLSNFTRGNSHLQTVQARRAVVAIGVIDDESFAPQTNLQAYGYKISPIGDVKSLSEVANFHIILCDIMGVGKFFDSKLQGASLISEIKKTFPEKIVIAYTGAMMNERAAKLAAERADAIIKKDIDIEDWIKKLDEFGELALNPYIIWNKIRNRLVELDVDTRDILLLEDAYVESILKKDSGLSVLSKKSLTIQLGPDVRAILQGLASSAIFSAIVGQ